MIKAALGGSVRAASLSGDIELKVCRMFTPHPPVCCFFSVHHIPVEENIGANPQVLLCRF
jgi:hypothetical protein